MSIGWKRHSRAGKQSWDMPKGKGKKKGTKVCPCPPVIKFK